MATLSEAFDLALQRFRAGDQSAAQALCERILAAAPDQPQTLHLLANLSHARKRFDEALNLVDRALTRLPGDATFHMTRGIVLKAMGRPSDAATAYRRALQLDPSLPGARLNLGNLLCELDELPAAAEQYRAALPDERAKASLTNTLMTLAQRAEQLGQTETATAFLRDAIQADPRCAPACVNLGNLLMNAGRPSEARACYERALEIDPDQPEALHNLPNALVELDERERAVRHLRALLARQPDAHTHSNLIFHLDLDPLATPQSQLRERLTWDRLYGGAGVERPALRSSGAPLRVGYVSADFRRHSAAAVFTPVILHHDPRKVRTFCYSDVVREDDLTRRLRGHVGEANWRRTAGLSDAQVAAMVRRDGIDLLVDLSGHSAGNRLTLLAQRPAPVQATGWGHAVGTGLSAIDYLLTDRVLAPPSEQRFCVERFVYLPNALCFAVPLGVAEVGQAPVHTNGFVTFGCFNRLAKVTTPVLQTWATLLHEVPRSRLLIKAVSLNDPHNRLRIQEFFADRGVDAGRILLEGGGAHAEHLRAHLRVDIALDPFPQNGGVSSLEAMWMGLPVVTLRGRSIPGRIGASLLTALKLEELIAADEAAYVGIAAALARDTERLSGLRGVLRGALLASPLCDHARYTAAVEEAYLQMIRQSPSMAA